MDLKEEQILGGNIQTHWYYRAKMAALLNMLEGISFDSILDVGAGSGFFARSLLAKTAAVRATCVDPNYTADSDDAVAGKSIRFRRRIDSDSSGLVLMMDVIEHVADDRRLLAEYVDMAAPGARFFVSVPAFMWLWSSHDVFLEHYRRYTLAGLETALKDVGLRIERANYFFGAVLPLVAAVRAWKKVTREGQPAASDMRSEAGPINSLLYAISALEARVMRANRIGGTSAFALAIKP